MQMFQKASVEEWGNKIQEVKLEGKVSTVKQEAK